MRTIYWMLGTGLATAAVAFGIGLILPELTPISQAEGAYAMGLIFFITPAAFVAGLVIGLILARITRR